MVKACDDIVDFIDNYYKVESPLIMAILGEPGSGKTLFARCIVDYLKKHSDLQLDTSKIGTTSDPVTVVLGSSINAEYQKKFLNSWRPILQ